MTTLINLKTIIENDPVTFRCYVNDAIDGLTHDSNSSFEASDWSASFNLDGQLTLKVLFQQDLDSDEKNELMADGLDGHKGDVNDFTITDYLCDVNCEAVAPYVDGKLEALVAESTLTSDLADILTALALEQLTQSEDGFSLISENERLADAIQLAIRSNLSVVHENTHGSGYVSEQELRAYIAA